MNHQQLDTLNRWCERFEDVGLEFTETANGMLKVTFRGRKYAPYKMTINLEKEFGHVESSGDFEQNHGGHTRYGTMWDEDESERQHGTHPFEAWVVYYLERMAKILRGAGDKYRFVGGI